MLIIIPQSHLDHDLSVAHLRFVLKQCSHREAFFVESLALPDELPALPCSLRGPLVGNPPVKDANAFPHHRNGRPWPSRMWAEFGYPDLTQPQSSYPRSVRAPSRLITIIGGPAEGHPCVLYTAYGGPLAPKEPGDPSLQEPGQEEALAASVAFWAEHALIE